MNKRSEEQRGRKEKRRRVKTGPDRGDRRTGGVDDTVMTRWPPIGPSEAPQVSPEHDL